MTKFGEILPLWQNLKNPWTVYLVYGKILSLLWQFLYAVGQIFIAVNGQMMKNDLPIYRITLFCVIDPRHNNSRHESLKLDSILSKWFQSGRFLCETLNTFGE